MRTTNKVTPDTRPVKAKPYWEVSIPGDLALMCLDCQTIWDVRAGACPCGSRAALHIIKALDREGVQVTR
jgi:hypothetical protein